MISQFVISSLEENNGYGGRRKLPVVFTEQGIAMLSAVLRGDVAVTIYTQERTKLTKADVENFNAQYPTLEIKYTKVFHDRFLILDRTIAYHVGAFLKDAGKKVFWNQSYSRRGNHQGYITAVGIGNRRIKNFWRS